MRSLWKSLTAGSVVVATTATGGMPVAAQAPVEPAVLSLQDALTRALEHSPQYRQALNNLELAGPQSRRAWGGFLPSLNASYGTGESFRRETTALDNFGNPIENPQAETVFSSSSGQGVSLGVDLFQGGRRFHELGRARADAEVTRRAGEQELNDVLRDVQGQFIEAQKQRALLAEEEELLQGRRRDLELTQRLYELASKTRSDLIGSELELEQQRVAVGRSRGEYQKALLALKRVIGDPALGDVDVDGGGPEVFDPAGIEITQLLQEAMSASPTVREAMASSNSSQAALKVERSSRWPSLSLNSNLNRQSFGRNEDALFDFGPRDFSGSIALQVSIPLFSRFETSYQIAQADVAFRNSVERVRQVELQVEEDVQAKYVDLQTTWSTVQQSARGLELAEERLRIVREEYRLAAKSFEDLQLAVRQAGQARRDVVNERFAFFQALLDVHHAAGVVAQEAGLIPAPGPGTN